MRDETKTSKNPKCDREAWGPGPWQDEPDRVEWRTDAGLMGIALRQPHSGHWCGYVGVEPGHPWHGKDDTTIYEGDAEAPSVHGGITYGSECAGEVCHVPAPGEPEHLWWIGFDCAHAGDYTPSSAAYARQGRECFSRYPGEAYRTLGYVRSEVERLASQAKARS